MTRLTSYGENWKNVHSPKITNCNSHKLIKILDLIANNPQFHDIYGKTFQVPVWVQVVNCEKCGYDINQSEDRCTEITPSGNLSVIPTNLGCYWHVVCCEHCETNGGSI